MLELAFADLGPPGALQELAHRQAAVHRDWVAEYERRAAGLDEADPQTPRRCELLAAGRAVEAAYVAFWQQRTA